MNDNFSQSRKVAKEILLVSQDGSQVADGWYVIPPQLDGKGTDCRWMGKQATIPISTNSFVGLFPLSLQIKGSKYLTLDILQTFKVAISHTLIQGTIKHHPDKSWEFEGIIPPSLLQPAFQNNPCFSLTFTTDKVEFIGDNLLPFSVAVSQVILTPIVSSLYRVNFGAEFMGSGWKKGQQGKVFQSTASILMSYPEGLFVDFTISGKYPTDDSFSPSRQVAKEIPSMPTPTVKEILAKLSIRVNNQPLSGNFDYTLPDKWCYQGTLAKDKKFDANLCVVTFSLDSSHPLEILEVIAAKPQDNLLSQFTPNIDSFYSDKKPDKLQQYYLENICQTFIELASWKE